MSRFLQLHFLTSYPPANLNRDDLGRPKTAKMGGVDRLRVSSQSLKRTWRTSDLFQAAMGDHSGDRTKLFGIDIFKYLIKNGADFKTALENAKKIAGVFGKNESPIDLKKEKNKESLEEKLKKQWVAWDTERSGIADYPLENLNELTALEISQLSFISPEEKQASYDLADKVLTGNSLDKDLSFLRNKTTAVDIAMFGRMLADTPSKNIEAACQVAHAISVHSIVIEDDYFTAIDDLNNHQVDSGAAHIGETGFAAGLFYSYVCINKEMLISNLDGDEELASRAIRALTEAAVKVSPEGKQNSYASRAYASYVLAEAGDQQPRSLSAAFLKPIEQKTGADDLLIESIKSLRNQMLAFDKLYESCADSRLELCAVTSDQINAIEGVAQGNISELLAFLSE